MSDNNFFPSKLGLSDTIQSMKKLPDFDMQNVRNLEKFISHRAASNTIAWQSWEEVKKFIVEVRQIWQ